MGFAWNVVRQMGLVHWNWDFLTAKQCKMGIGLEVKQKRLWDDWISCLRRSDLVKFGLKLKTGIRSLLLPLSRSYLRGFEIVLATAVPRKDKILNNVASLKSTRTFRIFYHLNDTAQNFKPMSTEGRRSSVPSVCFHENQDNPVSSSSHCWC